MKDCVIDISHHNGKGLNFRKAKSAGIEGVIHKATQGTGYVDKMFTANEEAVREAGLLFGAYHFGTGNVSGKKQAEYFLRHVDPETTLLALDFEPNPTGVDMTVAQAIEFCETVESVSGRPCVVYTGFPMSPQNKKLNNGKRPLWWAEYNKTLRRAPSDWPVVLWQYTDKGTVSGIGKCDRNKFDGDDLAAFWGVTQNAAEIVSKPEDIEKITTESRDDGTQNSTPASGAIAEPDAKEVKMSAMSGTSKGLTMSMIGSAILLALKEAWTSARDETLDTGKFALTHLPQVLLILGLAALGIWIYNKAMARRDARTNKIIDITADKSKNDVVIT